MKPLFKWALFLFPSKLRVSPFVQILLESIDCPEIFQRVELGLHEALVNAVNHGNGGDSSKLLRVRRIITPNWFIWQIQDEGEGLVYKKRKNSLPTEIDATSGRGLFLIHQCFDDVRWSRKGNRLQLSCRRNKNLS